ncbi:hypothetical protein CFIO01_07672 [Colletotrichum fioriniae PJ7]|uniref:Uncharacterized protein n=1 Tax=Colletotrichum fioriniae PJ7 TaxID=1445577 RepID=A0A010QVL7_9PEZI|nr:hypothetical protein CFIO01_07672 [Colletotrichum fioriniae PJ7]
MFTLCSDSSKGPSPDKSVIGQKVGGLSGLRAPSGALGEGCHLSWRRVAQVPHGAFAPDTLISNAEGTETIERERATAASAGRAQGVNTRRLAGKFDESSVLKVRLPLRVSGPNGKLEHWASNATTPAASAGCKTQDQLSRIHPYGYMAFSAKSHSQSGYLASIPIGR